MKTLLILFLVSLSVSTKAAITITQITGASSTPDLTLSTPKVFAGVSGNLACPAAGNPADGSGICDSCGIIPPGGPQATTLKCNEQQVGDNTILAIRLRSDSNSGTMELRDSTTSATLLVSEPYTAGQDIVLNVRWGDICALNPNSAGSTCDNVRNGSASNFTITLNAGVNTNGDNTIDDVKSLSVSVVNIPSGVSDGTDGIEDYTLYPGDQKAIIDDLKLYRNGFTGAKIKSVIFFFKPAANQTVPGGASACADVTNLNYLDASAEVEFETQTTTSTTTTSTLNLKSQSLSDAFENGVYYAVRAALRDEANNVGLFFDSTSCREFKTTVLPQPVSGLLSEGSGCFIATAAYGKWSTAVEILRNFRDFYLKSSELGRSFINFYYTHSPKIANYIKTSETLKAITRVALAPLVGISYVYVQYGSLAGNIFTSLLVILFLSLFIYSSKKIFTKFNKVKNLFLILLIFSVTNTLYAQEETFPQEPPYIEIEEDDLANLENSIENIKPQNSKEATDQTDLPENPRKWQPYQRVPEPERLKQLNEEEGLTRITKKGEFIYDVEKSPQKHAASLRFGTFEGPFLLNPTSGQTFQEVYGDETKVLLLFDYEWQFFQKFGKLGLKIGSGMMYAQGNGIFSAPTYFDGDGDGTAETLLEGKESYSLFVLPNNVSIIYRAQFYDTQWIVPFAEAGIDYFTMLEYREDGNDTNFAGAPHFHFAVGGSFSLNTLSRQLSIDIDREYGVNNIWITGEYRRLELITGDFDFSDDIFSAGFTFEF